LIVRGRCVELPLAPVSATAVAKYLTAHFPGLRVSEELAQWIYQRTDGNPLFLISVVEHLVARGILAREGDGWGLRGPMAGVDVSIPESLRQMIAQHLDRLTPDERQVIEAASGHGLQFSAAVVAAVLKADVANVERCCDGLARRRQIVRRDILHTAAESCFQQAVAIAHGQGAKSLELRAAMSLSRLWDQQGKGPEARQVLSEVYLWFTEGLDSPDLRTATALLAH
jgi:hypothetical protein